MQKPISLSDIFTNEFLSDIDRAKVEADAKNYVFKIRDQRLAEDAKKSDKK